jgi:hypothetical protein
MNSASRPSSLARFSVNGLLSGISAFQPSTLYEIATFVIEGVHDEVD